LGEGRVGKTSVGRRWAENKIEQITRSTVAAAVCQKTVETKDDRMLNIIMSPIDDRDAIPRFRGDSLTKF
jgi:hypothetical protein